MSYSNKIISDFRTLAREEFERMLSHCKTPQEIDSFCKGLCLALDAGITREQVKNFLGESIENFNNVPHMGIMLSNLLELASNEGFELYATEGIIDLVNDERDGVSSDARYSKVPAFTSDKHSRDEKIEEAKAEFITILRKELYSQLDKASSLSEEQKLDKIQEQEKNNQQVIKNQAEMATRQPPQPGSEAYVIAEVEMLGRLESEFQHEGNGARENQNILEYEISNVVEGGNSIRDSINNITECSLEAVNSNQRNLVQFFRCHRQSTINELNLQENNIENINAGSSSHRCTIL